MFPISPVEKRYPIQSGEFNIEEGCKRENMFKRKKRRSRKFKEEYSDRVIDFEEARIKRRNRRTKIRPEVDVPVEVSQRKRQLRKRRVKFFGLALILIVIMVGISVGKVVMTRHEQNTALEKNRALKEKKKDLEKELKLVNEPEYIEEQARKQLKLVKPGEIIYIIDGDKKDNDKKNKKQ